MGFKFSLVVFCLVAFATVQGAQIERQWWGFDHFILVSGPSQQMNNNEKLKIQLKIILPYVPCLIWSFFFLPHYTTESWASWKWLKKRSLCVQCVRDMKENMKKVSFNTYAVGTYSINFFSLSTSRRSDYCVYFFIRRERNWSTLNKISHWFLRFLFVCLTWFFSFSLSLSPRLWPTHLQYARLFSMSQTKLRSKLS